MLLRVGIVRGGCAARRGRGVTWTADGGAAADRGRLKVDGISHGPWPILAKIK